MVEQETTYEPARWLTGHEVEVVTLGKSSSAATLRRLAARGFDVFLNLCDGAWFEEVAGLEVVEELERLGVAFTGPTSRAYALTKADMKRTALALGVATPAHAFVTADIEVERAARSLRLPVIVKHFDGCASIGLTPESRVRTPDELLARARGTIDEFGGALLEEFVEGHEYTVLVAENPDDPARPLVFPPVVCTFPPGESFKHFALKWHEYQGMRWSPCADPQLAERLVAATRQIFLATDGVSYARCDFRVDADGQPWYLEINTSCGIFYPPGAEGSADMILQNDPTLGHRGFMDHILRCALLRARKPARRPRRGFAATFSPEPEPA
ncbi:D-alanine--D-alanine ligase [Nannocystis bainbridge]|uniref:D-alanine--D-alanine ligase n=1 Tax=Nannocystis bainbridge TaxID=2995303 RepID=A0ABT5DS64_9BACT|nr:D-alanine--D-alanine ligase [Nannocystis bainbridge]MDC0716485.1 D-alanine--D-alanine ligase [Nannocystis bainbridge]